MKGNLRTRENIRGEDIQVDGNNKFYIYIFENEEIKVSTCVS